MKSIRVMLVAVLVAAMSNTALAQIPLADVEVRLVREPRGGCIGPCVNYTVTVRGNGAIEYEGAGLVEGRRTRSVSTDEVVTLVNEFLRARFFNALDTYEACCSSLVRNGDTVELHGVASADDPYVALTLRIGGRTKTVILRRDFPPDLGRLPELVAASADHRCGEETGNPMLSQRNPRQLRLLLRFARPESSSHARRRTCRRSTHRWQPQIV
jgi:uncharacterized protein DUF6438